MYVTISPSAALYSGADQEGEKLCVHVSVCQSRAHAVDDEMVMFSSSQL